MDLCCQSKMCLLFNMLSRLVITFLPRSKHLLIWLLQSPSAVILEPKTIKSDTVPTVSPSVSHEVMGLDANNLVFWMLIIKRCLLLGRKVMINLDSILKSRDITLPTKVCLVKAMVFPVVMYGCESWLWRRLSVEELMLLNCGVGEDSWESPGLQGDPTSPFWRRSALGFLWKEWC